MSEELLDEVEALNSIYGEGTLVRADGEDTDGEESVAVYVLRLPGGASSLRLGFPPGQAYPATRPPAVLGTEHASGGVRGAGARDLALFREVLARVYEPGLVCLYDAAEEFARRREEEAEAEEQENQQAQAQDDEDGNGDAEGEGQEGRPRRRDDDNDNNLDSINVEDVRPESLPFAWPPPWVVSEPIVENKSTFVAHVARVTSPRQARLYLAHLLSSDKRIRSATHNMRAWRIRGHPTNLGAKPAAAFPLASTPAGASLATGFSSSSGLMSSGSNGPYGGGAANRANLTAAAAAAAPAAVAYQDCDDDGETAAGSRLLHLMQIMDVWDAMVVVTRWYGGVKLGPRRFAVINAAARDGFVRAGLVVEAGKDKDKDKRKGR
ncbi:NAD(P)-binding domain protein [Purpureocillium lavendulum]|uniref:NAD(P)-binding domain protein n=1 Tax=Purpureocillium lavendulum TaxID=1247861 RepID=A0AB34FG41_9HYPO|nr:NAD(P)-binding domain protein [Purpureocillium lavendulum]